MGSGMPETSEDERTASQASTAASTTDGAPVVEGASPGVAPTTESTESAESAEEGSRAPSSSDPLTLLREELAELRSQNSKLEGRLDEQSRQSVAVAPPKVFTRSELQEQVDTGRISEEQRDDVLDRQRTTQVKDELRQEMREERREERVRTRVAAYTAKIPGLRVDGNENRTRVATKYQEFVEQGLPEGAATELAALDAIFGSPDIPADRTRERREVREETGGGAPPAGESGANWKQGLGARQAKHFERMLETGHYRGTDDPTFVRRVAIARGGDAQKLQNERRAAGAPH